LLRTIFQESEILTFCVHPQDQNKGLGTLLVDHCLQEIEGPLFLEVSVENVKAYHLYEKKGFFTIGRRKGYYGGNIDAWIMRKE
jgi:ribosomal-protein-alanine N-acetyltransferase